MPSWCLGRHGRKGNVIGNVELTELPNSRKKKHLKPQVIAELLGSMNDYK